MTQAIGSARTRRPLADVAAATRRFIRIWPIGATVAAGRPSPRRRRARAAAHPTRVVPSSCAIPFRRSGPLRWLPPRKDERVDHGERRRRAAGGEHSLHGPAGGFGVEHGGAAATIAHTGQVNESALLQRRLEREQITAGEPPDVGLGREWV